MGDDTIEMTIELRRGSNHPKKTGTYLVWYTKDMGPEDMDFTVKHGWNTRYDKKDKIPDSHIFAWCDWPDIKGDFLFDDDEENEDL